MIPSDARFHKFPKVFRYIERWIAE